MNRDDFYNRRVRGLGGLLLILALGPGAGRCPGQTNGPALSCDQPVYDFGEHDNTRDVEHTFVLKSIGTESVAISQVRAGCGCSKTDLSTNTIAPGATATLTTRVCIKGLQGPKRTTVYVHSNDPAHPIYQLQLAGKAVSDVEIEPRMVSLQWHSGEALPAARVSIVNKSDLPFLVTGIEALSSPFVATVATNVAGRSYTLTVGISSNLSAGSSQGTVVVVTDHPRCARLEIPVSAFMQPDLLILPAQIIMASGDSAGQPQTRYVVLRSSQGKGFRVKAVESSAASIPAGIQSAKPTWARIRVGPFVQDPAQTNASITVRTDMAGMETIVIPFRAAPAQP